jgi:AcrR family transcriptional regulator
MALFYFLQCCSYLNPVCPDPIFLYQNITFVILSNKNIAVVIFWDCLLVGVCLVWGLKMSRKQTKREQTRERIVQSIHKGFREEGFAGAGVDGLAKGAGVTSGAFYAHLGSKVAAFRETVAGSVDAFTEGVKAFQEKDPERWLSAFADFYLHEKRACPLGQSCGLQSLSSDVGRSDAETKAVYEERLLRAAEQFAGELPPGSPPEAVWPFIAMLVGGATLARAVHNPAVADMIADSVLSAIKHGARE